jgi:hypothetical protein
MWNIVKILQSKNINYTLSGASREQIEQAEEALKLGFADEYRDYLAKFGVVSFGGHEFTGICTSSRLNVVDVTISERINNPTVPMDFYVVEQANIDGIVVWQSSTGEIYQTMPNMQPIKLCNSLCEYIDL